MTPPVDVLDRHRACLVLLGDGDTFRERRCPCDTVALVECRGCSEALYVRVTSLDALQRCDHVEQLASAVSARLPVVVRPTGPPGPVHPIDQEAT